MMKQLIALMLLIGMAAAQNLTVAYYHIGYGTANIKSNITQQGGENVDGILLVLAIAWVISWLMAFWLYETKRLVFAFAVYIAGLFAIFTALFVAIDSSAATNSATAEFLQMFVFPMTWLLIASIVGFILYILVSTMVKIAQTFGIKVENWWFDGKTP